MNPAVTVVVCTYNRSQSMARAVDSICSQNLVAPGGYEVVVVDDGSDDDTREVFAHRFGSSENVRFVEGRGGGPTTAYNDGVQAGRGEWIAFCDDDQEADTGWLQALYSAAHEQNATLVGGPILLRFPEGVEADLGRVGRLLYGEYLGSSEGAQVPLPPGGNRLIHRSVFDRVGRYDESISSGGADLEFALRARAEGVVIGWAASATMYHHVGENRLQPSSLRRYAFHAGYSRATVVAMTGGGFSVAKESLLRLAKASTLDVALLGLSFVSRSEKSRSDQLARISMALGFTSRACRLGLQTLGLSARQDAFRDVAR